MDWVAAVLIPLTQDRSVPIDDPERIFLKKVSDLYVKLLMASNRICRVGSRRYEFALVDV